ncbi:lactonase family protein [Streptococcus hongkongensis]|nr:carboxy-cis,cis-muconate cyclase [Streptococcus uberis]
MPKPIYFGTYTKRQSQGIYQADYDQESGQLANLNLLAKLKNSTYIAKSLAENFYVTTNDNENGGIVALNKHGQLINSALIQGTSLCHIAIDEKRQLVYGANYHNGQISLHQIDQTGSVTLKDTVQLEGAGPHPNQESAHAHYVGLTSDNYLVTCDLGTDSVTTYEVLGDFTLKKIANYQAEPGAGARHLVFHPTEKIAYLICELNSSVEVLIYNGLGHFEKLQTISTLPMDYQGFNATAAIRISKDGKNLYASNRGHHSIAVYTIRKDGQLDLLEIVPSQGHTPRDFILTDNQKHLIIPHQESDNISIFARNPSTGHLQLIANDFLIPESVCVIEG